jgi:MFS family permease
VPLVAIGFTRSPALIAGLAFAFTLPWLLFALPAGAIADRLDRRRLMLGANIARTALLAGLVLVVLLDAGTIWVLYAVALCVGAVETIYDTAAQAIRNARCFPGRNYQSCWRWPASSREPKPGFLRYTGVS